jgi:hypothetical protein
VSSTDSSIFPCTAIYLIALADSLSLKIEERAYEVSPYFNQNVTETFINVQIIDVVSYIVVVLFDVL